MGQRTCGGCGQVVYLTHHCRATRERSTTRPPEFWQWVAEARAEATKPDPPEQLALLDPDPTELQASQNRGGRP